MATIQQAGAPKKIPEPADEEIFSTPNTNDDFDQINVDKVQNAKFSNYSYSQPNQNTDTEAVDLQGSLKVFSTESQLSVKKRAHLEKSRQARIGNRLMQIRAEMHKLQAQLQTNLKIQEELQQQAQQAKTEGNEEKALMLQQKYRVASQQLDQFKFLKNRLVGLYRTEGFKSMVRSNPNMSQFFGLVQKDLETDDEGLITAQVTGRSVNMMEFSRMVEKLKLAHKEQQEAKDEQKASPAVQINIQYDKSQKDLGVLLKLNNLVKRLEVLKHLIGDWKPTTKKYQNITEQIRYVHRKLELLDENKVAFFSSRAKVLKEQVNNLNHQKQKKADADMARLRQKEVEMEHDKKTIDSLFAAGKQVKSTAEQLDMTADRLEQKRKVHDMAASILIQIEKMEEQQQNILKSAAQENKQVLEALQKGMKENAEIIRENVAVLKEKMEK